MKSILKKKLPVFVSRYLNRRGLYRGFVPPSGKISWGDFGTVNPFSKDFGFDRSGPIDRYYIENFLDAESKYVHGNVLEIADNAYTIKYGGAKVLKSDVLHLNADTPGATYVGDLSKGDHIPSNQFDCVILTQTLHLIYDYVAALKHCYRILKKGGVLLVTVPGISPIDRGEWSENWLWSFNDHSMKKIFSDLFPKENYNIQTYGNVYAAVAFLHGIGIDEVDRSKLNVRDTSYDVVVTIRLKK